LLKIFIENVLKISIGVVSLLVSWEVVLMFPNIDNNSGINTVNDALNSLDVQFPSAECIVEADKMC